ncbi:MAG: BlaI/MecI/CopY family transcriptional regulator [Oscillospiraceae bacterium]|nr:BlaI/MecI/CopY family transcriptional regulator [Oscillospiraceae bacterium]
MKKINLSAAEWEIMSMLWEKEPMTAVQITDAFEAEKGWTRTTVISFLKRMEAKNAVSYKKEKAAREYYTIVKREDVAVSETKSFLDRIYRGSIGMMVNSLIDQKALSKEDIDELYDILKKAEEKQNG